MASHNEWRVAYAKQAKVDLRAREQLLALPDLPDCQELHFLQMACEKICKAYLCGHGTDPSVLQSSHAYIASVLPIILREQLALKSRHLQKDHTWLVSAIRSLARKIELLAPAVQGGGAYPANCEYPWLGTDGTLKVPAEHNFQLDLLYAEAGRHLIKALYSAVDDLTGVE